MVSAELVVDLNGGGFVITYPEKPAERPQRTGLCTNNKKHGPAVTGGRCKRCWEAKRANDKVRDQAARVSKVA